MIIFCLFFFCRKKTAYEFSSSDWSSDVCSSDLQALHPGQNILGGIEGLAKCHAGQMGVIDQLRHRMASISLSCSALALVMPGGMEPVLTMLSGVR